MEIAWDIILVSYITAHAYVKRVEQALSAIVPM